MTSESGCFCLRSVKTLKSNMVIDVPDVVHNHLKKLIREQHRHPTQSYLNNKTEILIDKTQRGTEKNIQGGDFISRKENGENTSKYIKEYCKINTS